MRITYSFKVRNCLILLPISEMHAAQTYPNLLKNPIYPQLLLDNI